VLLAVVAIATACVPAASAADKARTTVKIEGATASGGHTLWGGAISSPREECRNERRVLVFRVRPGKDAKVGSTRSYEGVSVKGFRWSLMKPGTAPSGKYYAKVNPTDACKGDRSKDILGPS
jgi:hypothetical protein